MSPQQTLQAPEVTARNSRLSVVLPHTDLALTAVAMREAARLACGLDVRVTVLAVRIVPFPEALDPTRGCPGLSELLALAESAEAPVTINIVYARDWESACEQSLDAGSLVVVAVRKRWLRTREERLAAYLTGAGHKVTTVPA
jgi:hypothetical protein